jgi:hypothetical protein
VSLLSIATVNRTDQLPSANTKRAWLTIGVWCSFLALCLVARAGQVLVSIFPLGSVAIGLFLYFRTPVLYVGYTWWLFFVGSLIRRIIDQQSGYVTPGRWGTTALLVASISLITLVQHLPKISRYGGMPFLLALLGVTYGCLVGLVTGAFNLQFIISAMGWVIPIVFSFHLFINWQYYPQYQQAIQRAFVWGALVMGCYGIFQYCIAPDWDRFYLNNLPVTSFGDPLPFRIRVFSTQDSPQSFGTMMMASLILLLSSDGVLRFPASCAGYVAFLLSAARSAWLGWTAALLALLPLLKLKFQLRLVLSIVLIAMLVAPLAIMEPFAEPIQQRLESFSEGRDDVSLKARQEGYQDLLALALTEFIGGGIGGQLSRELPKTTIGGADSGVLPLLFSLGWFGTLPYLAGIFLILFRIFTIQESGREPFSSANRAIVVGSLAQVGLNNIFAGDMGMVLWGFLGIGMAASQFYSYQRQLKISHRAASSS